MQIKMHAIFFNEHSINYAELQEFVTKSTLNISLDFMKVKQEFKHQTHKHIYLRYRLIPVNKLVK
jgi:hypothetical protein